MPAAPPPAALLFDLGGVLIDVDFGRAIAHWSRASGVPRTALAARFVPDGAFRRHERGELSDGAYFDCLRAQLGLDLPDAALAAGWQAILGEELAGVRELLEALGRRLPLYLFSNSNPAHRAAWQRRHAALLALFEKVFVSCDIGLRKPDPAAFGFVVEHLGLDPAAVVFPDDSAANVAGARAAGLRAHRIGAVADVRRLLRLGPGPA